MEVDEGAWCEYCVFSPDVEEANNNGDGDDDDDGALLAFAARCEQSVAAFTANYLWQVDPFALSPRRVHAPRSSVHEGEDGSEGFGNSHNPAPRTRLPHAHGATRFGDCIADEWFIAALLLHITRAVPNTTATLVDSDGQVLLIEAALVLPRWLKPDVALHRVFLHAGEVHIVPQPRTPADLAVVPPHPSLPQALALVRAGVVDTRASREVQDAILARLPPFPLSPLEPPVENVHHASLLLPVPVARVVEALPWAVSPAVTAFYYRDVHGMRACQALKHTRPAQSSVVRRRVRLTRCLYAQLLGQHFPPPAAYPPLPAHHHPHHKPASLGMKLVCGFEILCAAHERERRQLGDALHNLGLEASHADAIAQHPRRWAQFQGALRRCGFYDGALEGSQPHRDADARAAAYFARWVHQQQHRPERPPQGNEGNEGSDEAGGGDEEGGGDEVGAVQRANDEHAAARVATLLGQFKAEEARGHEGGLAEQGMEDEDDDSWLNISEAQLEQLLRERAGYGDVQRDVEGVEGVVSGLTRFVDKLASHEGAEAPRVDLGFSSEEEDDDEEEEEGEEGEEEEGEDDGDDEGADFNPDEFVAMMKGLLGALGGKQEGDRDKEDEDDEEGPDGADLAGLEELMREMDEQLKHTDVRKQRTAPDLPVTPSPHEPQRADGNEEEHANLGPAQPAQRERREGEHEGQRRGPEMGEAHSGSKAAVEKNEKNEENEEEDEGNEDDVDEDEDGAREEDMDEDLRLDFEVAKNALESFQAQHGMVGPVSNLLASMGLSVQSPSHPPK